LIRPAGSGGDPAKTWPRNQSLRDPVPGYRYFLESRDNPAMRPHAVKADESRNSQIDHWLISELVPSSQHPRDALVRFYFG